MHDRIADAGIRFARDTAEHQLTVARDDGLYRHLQFRNPASWGYGFDVVTWPGVVHLRGDLGRSYTISRQPDMLAFIRGRRPNPHYWSEKLDDGPDSVREYDETALRSRIVESVVDAIRGGYAPPGLGKAVQRDILARDLAHEDTARRLVDEFEHYAYRVVCNCRRDRMFGSRDAAWRWEATHTLADDQCANLLKTYRTEPFMFDDACEWDVREYTPEFLWVCHAIVWAVAQYDAHQATQRERVAAGST